MAKSNNRIVAIIYFFLNLLAMMFMLDFADLNCIYDGCLKQILRYVILRRSVVV